MCASPPWAHHPSRARHATDLQAGVPSALARGHWLTSRIVQWRPSHQHRPPCRPPRPRRRRIRHRTPHPPRRHLPPPRRRHLPHPPCERSRHSSAPRSIVCPHPMPRRRDPSPALPAAARRLPRCPSPAHGGRTRMCGGQPRATPRAPLARGRRKGAQRTVARCRRAGADPSPPKRACGTWKPNPGGSHSPARAESAQRGGEVRPGPWSLSTSALSQCERNVSSQPGKGAKNRLREKIAPQRSLWPLRCVSARIPYVATSRWQFWAWESTR